MKKEYVKPAMRVVCILHQDIICGSIVIQNRNNVGLNEEIFEGSGPARARSYSYWDDEDY